MVEHSPQILSSEDKTSTTTNRESLTTARTKYAP